MGEDNGRYSSQYNIMEQKLQDFIHLTICKYDILMKLTFFFCDNEILILNWKVKKKCID